VQPVGLRKVSPEEKSQPENIYLRNVPEGNGGTLTTTEPDNAARNVRDRNSATLTSFDQGTDKADVATTAQIRKGIIADKNI